MYLLACINYTLVSLVCGFDRSVVALTECAKRSVVKICICLQPSSQQSITQMAKNTTHPATALQ